MEKVLLVIRDGDSYEFEDQDGKMLGYYQELETSQLYDHMFSYYQQGYQIRLYRKGETAGERDIEK